MNRSEKIRMRTIPKAYEELKKIDKDTDISIRMLRRMCQCGEIPTYCIGNKKLINVDLLIEKLSCYNGDATHII